MSRVVPLRWPDDARRVLDLALRADDYLQMERGRSANIDWVAREFTEAPPGKDSGDLRHLGLEHAGTLAGFATLVRRFRDDAEWFIGLMLFDPAHRGRGLGPVLLRAIEARAAADGARTLRLVVLPQNPRARRFWEREGFAFHGRSAPPPGQPGKPVLVKALAGG